MIPEFWKLTLLFALLAGQSATLNKENGIKRPTNTTLKNFPPKFSWFKSFVGLRKFSSVVTSSKHCCPCLFFPLILLCFRWFVGLMFILHKWNTTRWNCSSSVARVVLEAYFRFPEAKFGFLNHYIQPWIWGLHSVPIVINLVIQSQEIRIDITEKCCVTYSNSHYLGNSGNKCCTKKWPSVKHALFLTFWEERDCCCIGKFHKRRQISQFFEP